MYENIFVFVQFSSKMVVRREAEREWIMFSNPVLAKNVRHLVVSSLKRTCVFLSSSHYVGKQHVLQISMFLKRVKGELWFIQ